MLKASVSKLLGRPNSNMTNFNIDIVSDTVCPWCYIGKKRLEQGIADYRSKNPSRNDTFTINWLPYYLNPNAPRSVDKREYYLSKFGEQRTQMMYDRLSGIGKETGIAFKFGGKTGTTRDSHRLIQFAKTKSEDAQNKVVAELFKAYFEEERDITSQEVLLDASVKAGLEEKRVKELLESDEFGEVVDEEVGQAQKSLITGVPYFTLNSLYEISGGQEPRAFVHLFEKLAQVKS